MRVAAGASATSPTSPLQPVPVGDMDKFLELTNALSLAAFRLARFQSPTLQAIAVAQQQSQASEPSTSRSTSGMLAAST